MTLRPYQKKAVDTIRDLYAKKVKKVLLHMATGSGKTVIFAVILKGVHDKGKFAILVVHGRKLVDQASKRLDREGIPHGVLMAGHWRTAAHESIQICSIDTLFARKLTPKADLVVIDEAHQGAGPRYKWLAEAYADKFFLPVTATPYSKISHLAEIVVKPVDIQDLIDGGFLVPPVYYAPFDPDLSGVRISKGDYNQADLSNKMSESKLVGDIVPTWQKYGQNRPTICFAVSVAHSMSIENAFNAAGIPAIHIDAKSTDDEREAAIKKLETGETRVLVNCGILCTGVDIPPASCIIMARPTKSYSLYIQQAGRGTRIFPGKSDFIILDHAGNIMRHGFITDEQAACIDGVEKPKVVEVKRCEGCFAIYDPKKFNQCPQCGYAESKKEVARKSIKTEGGELVPLDRVASRISHYKQVAKDRGYNSGWVYYKIKDEFGQGVADLYCKKRTIPPHILARLKSIAR